MPGTERKSTRYLGLPDDNPLDPQMAPFAFYIRRPAGDVTPEHSHQANRIEFVIAGRIEWRERGKDPVEYGAGTFTYVEADTVYGYTVIEDATILIVFERAATGEQVRRRARAAVATEAQPHASSTSRRARRVRRVRRVRRSSCGSSERRPNRPDHDA